MTMDIRDTDDQAHLDRWQPRAPAPREFCPRHKNEHLGGTQVPFLRWAHQHSHYPHFAGFVHDGASIPRILHVATPKTRW